MSKPTVVLDWDDDESHVNGSASPESFDSAKPVLPSDRMFQRPETVTAVSRTLPHSLEAEEYLLSSCLLDGADIVSRCLESRIQPNSFYDSKHGIIYERLLALYHRQTPIDISVVAEELKTARQLDQVGGYAFLTQVSSRIPTTAQAGYFIEKVREQALLREIIRSATVAVEDCYAYSGDIEDLLTTVRTKIQTATDGSTHSLASRKFNPGAKIVDERIVLSLGKVPLATAGNLTNIVAMSGVGKTAGAGAIIAASFITGTDDADCLGFNGPNYAHLPLLHFDTEQSLSHYQRNLNRALARSGRAEFPPWFHSYHLTGLAAPQCRHAVESLITSHARKAGGIFEVLIDGWADLVVSPNDERECFPFVTRMQDLAIRHDMPIIGILHLNPVSKATDPTKGRGHLGSHLDRKAETVLQLEMDADGVTSMFTTKKRGIPIPKSGAPAFKWSDEHQMHRSTAAPERPVKGMGGRPTKYDFKKYRNIFPAHSTDGMELTPLNRTLNQNGVITAKSLPDVLERWAEEGRVEIISPAGRPTRYRLAI